MKPKKRMSMPRKTGTPISAREVFFVALHFLIVYLLDGCKINSQGLNLRGCYLEIDVALSSGLVVL